MAESLFSTLSEEFVEEQNNEEEDPEILKNNMLTSYEFKTPVEYHNAKSLNDIIKSDLELDSKENKNIYSQLLHSPQEYPQLLMNQWSSLYTTNTDYLKDHQKLLKKYKKKETTNMDEFVSSYLDFKGEQNFLGKYQYIQFRRFFFLNSIIGFLQCLAIYNICSPLLSLFAPIIGLIVPYFIFYFRGIKMSFSSYMSMVKMMILNNSVVKNLLNFRKGNLQNKCYTLVYIFFYILGVYNNVNSCIQFYKNTKYMIEFNSNYYNYLEHGDDLIDHIHESTQSLESFTDFNKTMLQYKNTIQEMKSKVMTLNQQQNKMIKCGQIGVLLKYNFDIFYNKTYHDTIMYLIYLNQYHKNMKDISHLVKEKKLRSCKYNTSKATKVKDMYYLTHMNNNPVKNTISLDKNVMITGPNASGKTTIIKSAIINIFLSQSIGVGCYRSCVLNPYSHFHSYLNIPDTSNRDSLFQAEARRCKNIFSFIQKNRDKRHLCIFDEIYSGTNPQDAVRCASVYIKGMNELKQNTDYILTTHYLELCEQFEYKDKVKNQKMDVIENENEEDIQYTYILKDGISKVHGGYQVLRNLNYPPELLEE